MDGVLTRAISDRDLAVEFATVAGVHDRAASFPSGNLARLREFGLLGLTASPDDGGADAGLARVVSLVGTIAEGCPSTALILAMQLIHHKAIAHNAAWPTHLRARVGRSAVQDGALINALRVEPALGTPARGGLPDTVARRTKGGWSLSGRKIYSTGAPGLAWLLVWARTDETAPRTGMWLVPAASQGVEIMETWDQLGLRASGSHDVVLRDVEVPEDNAVDIRLPQGWGAPDATQTAWNTLTIAALYTGVARAARNWLVFFLKDRTPSNLGAPLATLPRMQEAVGAIDALLLANRRLIEAAAAEHDRGFGPPVLESQLIKTIAAENAISAVERAMALTGNHGLSRANPLERHLRDVLCARIHTPQVDAAHVAAGRVALGQ